MRRLAVLPVLLSAVLAGRAVHTQGLPHTYASMQEESVETAPVVEPGDRSAAVALGGTGQGDLLVTTLEDVDDRVCDAHCSLREAISWANANIDTTRISFVPALAGQTMALRWGELTITSSVVIDGEDLRITVDGGGASRVFKVSFIHHDVTFVGLTITGGRAPDSWDLGGGVFCEASNLTLDRVTLRGNTAGAGGGLYAHHCVVIIRNSTISGNTAEYGGGARISSDYDAEIVNSTISGNTAGNQGGGLSVGVYELLGETRLYNTTVTDNHAGAEGGGIFNDDGLTPYFYNSIVAGNTAYGQTHHPRADCRASEARGHSLVGRNTGCGRSDTDGTVPAAEVFTRVLSPILAHNGGPTRTHALLWRRDNRALDIGGTCRPTDQRGFPAPLDGPDLDAAAECDAGSVEAGPPPPVTLAVAPVNPPIVIPPEGGAFACTVTLTNQTAEPQALQAWVEAVQPDGTVLVAPYGPLFRPFSVVLGPGEAVERELVQAVPAVAMAGEWTYAGYAGAYPDSASASGGFVFTKEAALAGREAAGVRGGGTAGSGGASGPWSVVYAESGAPVMPGDVWTGDRPARASSEAELPSSYALHGARPNPFAVRTVLGYDLPAASHVRLAVYDVLGREVAVLVDGVREAGRHDVALDGARLPAGTYLVRLEAGSEVQTQRITLVR
jgi:CSLREA domain-containing protein